VQHDFKVSIGMPVDSKRLSHPDFHSQFFADFPLQPGRQFLAFLHLAAGKLPHPAQQPMRGAPCHQYQPIPLQNGSRHRPCGNWGTGFHHRSLLLDAQRQRFAELRQGT